MEVAGWLGFQEDNLKVEAGVIGGREPGLSLRFSREDQWLIMYVAFSAIFSSGIKEM